MIRIGPIRLEEDARVLSADLTFSGATRTLFFRSESLPLAHSPEAFLCAALTYAMTRNEDIEFDPPQPVCYQFLQNYEAAQALYGHWKRKFKHARVTGAQPVVKPFDAVRQVGVFFSAGVDGSATFLRHRDEIEHLILIHGFEMRLAEKGWRDLSRKRVQAAADALGKPLAQFETNLREVFDTFDNLRWLAGPILTSVAHAASPSFRKVYLASAWTFDHLDSWSTHPLMDRYYSSEALTIVHDASEVSRQRKLEMVAAEPAMLQNLRTCWLNDTDALNCGRCEKCVRTMIGLHVCGALGKTDTYPARLDLDHISTMRITFSSISFYEEFLRRAREMGDAPLAAALRQTLRHVKQEKKPTGLKALRKRLTLRKR